MEPTRNNDFEVVDNRKRIDVKNEIAQIPVEKWKAGDVRREQGRYLNYTLSAKNDESGYGREYTFEIRIDLISGVRVGAPKLNVASYMDDAFKPTIEPIKTFTGTQAEALFAIVQQSVLPANAAVTAGSLSEATLGQDEPG